MIQDEVTKHGLSAARYLLNNSQFTVTFSGAGLSAESGVGTFRGAQHGNSSLAGADQRYTDYRPGSDKSIDRPYWEQFDPRTMATPEGFTAAPNTVLSWYHDRRRQVLEAKPNAGHRALAAKKDWVHVTQNVDNLLERAGTEPESIFHLHGDLMADRCHASCGYRHPIGTELSPTPPKTHSHRCPDCISPLRPDVVWFGERLSNTRLMQSRQAIDNADVLLVIGTSAVVFPAAGLIMDAQQRGVPVILVNLAPSLALTPSDIEIIGPASEVLPELLLD